MIITIEVMSNAALYQLKEMEDRNEIRLVTKEENPLLKKHELTDEERSAIIRSLHGATLYDKKRVQEQLDFVREGRGH